YPLRRSIACRKAETVPSFSYLSACPLGSPAFRSPVISSCFPGVNDHVSSQTVLRETPQQITPHFVAARPVQGDFQPFSPLMAFPPQSRFIHVIDAHEQKQFHRKTRFFRHDFKPVPLKESGQR